MNVGVVGLGKVGLPLALVMAHHAGHQVVGYDLDRARVAARLADHRDHGEAGLGGLLQHAAGKVQLTDDPADLVAHADVLFVVVPTPIPDGLDGSRPTGSRLASFDDGPLTDTFGRLTDAASELDRDPVVAVVSTVLPGTLARLQARAPGSRLRLVYNPVFISLGRTVTGLLHPEYLLLGSEDLGAAQRVERAWQATRALSAHEAYYTTVASAELIKVALNAWLSTKIVYANALAGLCQQLRQDGLDADVDEVTAGLHRSPLAMGPMFLKAGMGDGGPCRPRDALALAWLTDRYDVGHNPFAVLVNAREAQAMQLAARVAWLARTRGLPVAVLGSTYKPGSRIEDGAAARLLCEYLSRFQVAYTAFDPVVYGHQTFTGMPRDPRVFVLAVPHRQFRGLDWPPGSVILDPWGEVDDQEDVTVIRWGRR